MNKNRLLIAIVVLAVLAGALASSLRSRQSDTVAEKPKATLPQLKRDDISKVELENPEKRLKLALSKQDGKWALSAPLAAKVDNAAVDALLDKLSDLEVTSIAVTRKENHERVGVDRPARHSREGLRWRQSAARCLHRRQQEQRHHGAQGG